MPEYRNHPNPTYQNERVRGTGGLGVTSFGEENLLNLPLDRYDDESIAVHEFCHTIDAALRPDRPRAGASGWARPTATRSTRGCGRTPTPPPTRASTGPRSASRYFDCNRVNNWNHGPIGTREQLKQYDPDGYELVRDDVQPDAGERLAVPAAPPAAERRSPPPAKFKIDPYYTKFTYAREFPVLGSKHVSDEALLKANDTIRKMFAYRHDILKAMIADGAGWSCSGRTEKLSDLPGVREAQDKAGFDEVRYLDYTPDLKLMVVPEENVLRPAGRPVRRAGAWWSACSPGAVPGDRGCGRSIPSSTSGATSSSTSCG